MPASGFQGYVTIHFSFVVLAPGARPSASHDCFSICEFGQLLTCNWMVLEEKALFQNSKRLSSNPVKVKCFIKISINLSP